MQLLEMEMQNFRCYTSQSIKFPLTTGKPVVSMIGEGGSGKTTVFLAIIWALYGERAIKNYSVNRPNDKQAPKSTYDLMNTDNLENSERPFMRVSLIFEHESKKFTLRRRVSAKWANPRSDRDLNEDVELLEHGKSAGENNPELRLEDILPFEASQFFLFDGEDIRRYSGAKPLETQKAIELVLGIPEIREARDDLIKIQRRLLEKLKESDLISDNLRLASDGLSHAITDVAEIDNTLSLRQKEFNAINEELTEAEIRRSELKEIQELNIQLQHVISDKKAIDESITENLKQKDTLVKKLPYYLMIPQLRATLERFKRISDTDDVDAKLAEFKVKLQVIDELLDPKSDKCLCGASIGEDTRKHYLIVRQAFEKRHEELQFRASKKTIPPIEDIKYVLGRLESLQVDFKELDRKINSLRMRSLDLDNSRITIENKIKGSNVDEATKVQGLIERLREKKGGLESEINILKGRLNETMIKRDSLQRIVDKATKDKGDYAVISGRQQLASTASKAFDWIVSELAERKKEVIFENATKYFDTVSGDAGWKGIEIDENYSIWLLDYKGRHILPSEGWKELVALSFIFGLNKAANYTAPVVMDFVLGRLDASRQVGVVNNLSDFADQVILLLLDSEIQQASVRRKLESLGSAKYLINRNEKTGTSTLTVPRE